MISHNFSSRIASPLPAAAGKRRIPGDEICGVASGRCGVRGDGPLRVERHAAARLQRARFDPRLLPLGARPRRFRRALLLSGAGSPGDRRRRECADGGDRGGDRALCPVLGRAGAIRHRALRHQRDAEDRRRGPRDLERSPQAACGDHARRWPSSALATSFRSGSPAGFKASSRRPPKRCARSKPN